VDEVRRIGIDAWIEVQLRPDRLAENPLAESCGRSRRSSIARQISVRYPAARAFVTRGRPRRLHLRR